MDTCVLLPDALSLVLTMHPNPKNILEMNVALWSNRALPVGTKFKPNHGTVRLDKLEVYSELKEDDVRNEFGSEDSIQIVDGKEVRHCNWVRFLKTSDDIQHANLVGVKVKDEAEFLTVRTILPNEEIVAFLQTGNQFSASVTAAVAQERATDEHEETSSTVDLSKVKEEMDVTPVSPVPFPGSRDLLTSPPSREDDCKSSVSDSSPSSGDETSPSSGSPDTEHYTDTRRSPYYSSLYPQQLSPLNLTSPRTPSKSPYTSDMSSVFTSPLTSTTTTSRSPLTSPSELSPPMQRLEFESPPLESRSRLKRNRERTWLPCDVCGKKFDRPSLLKRHIRTHTGEKPHACDVCGKAFSTSSSLNTHRRIHSGEKPHQCGVCGKRFTASSNLYYHRMTHNKEKPHKCQMCSKSFPTPGDLRSHMYVHNGSWPYRCEICNRGFSKQTNMKNHMLLHTGDKPHECPKCQKKFALFCNLKTHLKTHEDDNQGRCVTCGRTFLKKPDVISDECIDCIRAASPDSTQRTKKPVSDFSISKLTNCDDKDDEKSSSSPPNPMFDPRFHPFYNPLMMMTTPMARILTHDHQPIGFLPVMGMASLSDQKEQLSRLSTFNPNMSLAELAYQSQISPYRHDWSGLLAK